LMSTESRLAVDSGYLVIGKGAGLGIELDPDAVEQYRLQEAAR
jgi:L-alanine-DL-glutamate epimerase-like enolase superfamily enzyme